MRLAILLLAVLVLTVALPAGAVLWSRARYLKRPATVTWVDLLHVEARRQRLTHAQVEAVSRAVNSGVAAPPDLRRLAARVAAAKVETLEKATNLSRRVRIAFLIYLVSVITLAIGVAVRGHDLSAALVPALEVGLAGVATRVGWRRQLRRARQAADANQLVPPDSVAQKQPLARDVR